MNTLLITGISGTLGPVVAQTFARFGWRVVPWDHHRIPPDDLPAAEHFWQDSQADAVCHVALGPEHWAAWLAAESARADIPFVFTSSAMVFSVPSQGPYGIDAERNARDDYGQYKMRCEDAIWQANPQAMIARLGWQIGEGRGGNQMLEHLWQQHEQQGVIRASERWLPATSRMADTALGLMRLIERKEPGLYHFDSNAEDALNFFQLVERLQHYFDCPWQVTATEDYVHDQRLVDERFKLLAIHDWIPLGLPEE